MRRALAGASSTKSALQVSFTWRLGCSLSIDLPPLRKRRMDIPLSFDGCLREHCRRSGREIQGPTHEALAALVQYDGPGNIRELKTSSTEC